MKKLKRLLYEFSCRRKEKKILKKSLFKQYSQNVIRPRLITAKGLLKNGSPTVLIVLVEHLGDVIACEPIIGYAKKMYPGHKIAWITKVQYCETLFGHPNLDYLVPTCSLAFASEFADKFARINKAHEVINLHFHSRYCAVMNKIATNRNDAKITDKNYYFYGSILESFAQCAGLGAINDAPNFYILPDVVASEVRGNYVICHAKSNESERDWDVEKWKELQGYLYGQGLYVVEIGWEPVLASSHPMYIDMTRLRSIQKIAKLLSHSSFFFGIDSSFAHLANALEKNGIVIMGRYRDFTEHIPYTGLYSSGHIVRSVDSAAFDVTSGAVISFYEKIK